MQTLGYCILHQHDLRILSLSVVLILLTLFISSRLFHQSQQRSRHRPAMWMTMASVCVGVGVWSVHFVAMLAYLPGLPIGFAPLATVESLALITAAALLAFPRAMRSPSTAVQAGWGGLLGLGVAAMHYVGVSALRAPGRLEWSLPTVAVSILAVVGFSAVGYVVGIGGQFGGRARSMRLLAGGGIIAAGVLLLHFVGMSAIVFHFDPRQAALGDVISRPLLAVMVSGAAALILGCGAASLWLERRDRHRALSRMKLLSESSFEGVALVRDGRIAEVNAAFAEAAGLARSALLGRPFCPGLFEPDPGHVFGEGERIEGRLARGDGRTLPVEVLSRPVSDGDVILAVRDLTERRGREQSLSLLFNRNPAPVWVGAASGRILAVNPAALALYGYDEASFLQLRVNQLLPPDELAEAHRLFQVRQRYSADRVWRHLRSDGSEILVLPYTETIDFNGRPALLTTVFDVTERERTSEALRAAKEAAEAASLAKSTFLANVSHEIRTPLNGVLGMSQAIAAGELSAIQRERLQVVLQSGQSLLAILNNVLDLSKIEAGRLELEAIAFDLGALVGEVEASFRPLIEAKGLGFTVVRAEGIEGRVHGDPTRLRQVLFNLLSNALKFTSAGDITLTAAFQDATFKVAVSDTGEGIAADALGQLFQKFVQADASTTRRHGGTGLGLAISRELTDAMGGELAVTSTPGAGSTFSLTVPLQPLEPAVEETPVVELGGDATACEVRLLAAEDNPTNRVVLRTLLAEAGVSLTIVEDGLQALQAWREGFFDLILMDVQMPVMDGPSACRAIRDEEARSERPRTPILALTANVMRHQLEEYATAGMDGCVAKPIEVAKLFGALDDALHLPAAA